MGYFNENLDRRVETEASLAGLIFSPIVVGDAAVSAGNFSRLS